MHVEQRVKVLFVAVCIERKEEMCCYVKADSQSTY